MKKINKRGGLFVFILIAIFTFSIKVNAVSITTDTARVSVNDSNSYYVTNKATFTVTDVRSNGPLGDQFKAYKLLDAFYNSSSNTITYEFTSSFKNYLLSTSTYNSFTVDDYFELTSGDITSGSTKTTSTLDKLVSGYVSYIKNNNVVGEEMTPSGTSVYARLDAGAYFVLPYSTVRVYAVMVGNLDFEANGNEWILNDETIVAKVSDAGITKSISNKANKNMIQDGPTFEIVGTVPQYPTNATNKTYKIIDRLGRADDLVGLGFDELSNFVIKDGNIDLNVNADGTVTDASGNKVATITINGLEMTIDFNLDYITSTTVTVSYKVKLSEEFNYNDFYNYARLTYSNSPYTEDNKTVEAERIYVGVFGIEIFKYADSNKSKALSGATFDVFADSALTKKVGTIVTGNDGIGRLKGLGEGTYYLKETKAPAGYKLLDEVIRVDLELVMASSLDDEETINDFFRYERVEIPNAEAGLLPYTGGMGLVIYSLIGIVIIGIGTSVIIKIQKKKALNVTE